MLGMVAQLATGLCIAKEGMHRGAIGSVGGVVLLCVRGDPCEACMLCRVAALRESHRRQVRVSSIVQKPIQTAVLSQILIAARVSALSEGEHV